MAVVFLTAPLAGFAAEDKKEKEKPKPYKLETCLISDEKLGADPSMKPYAFVHAGREIKLCCQDCKKEFDKNPGKFVSKLTEAEKKIKDKPPGKAADKPADKPKE
jgi:YHS domain-containing protein